MMPYSQLVAVVFVSFPFLAKAFSAHNAPSRSLSQSTQLHVTQDDPILRSERLETELEDMDAVTTLAGNIVQCLFKSDLKRKGGGDGGGSTGWTSWVDDPSAYSLKCCIDSLAITKPINPKDISGLKQELLMERDNVMSWLRWMKQSPSPLLIDLSHQVRDVADTLINDKDMEIIETTREELLER